MAPLFKGLTTDYDCLALGSRPALTIYIMNIALHTDEILWIAIFSLEPF